MKKVFFLLIISAIVLINNTGCKQKSATEADSTKVNITVDEFLENPESWANKEVVISGTVSHICKHSGKKLFLFGADPEKTLKINAGGEISAFDLKYEGMDVEITGTVVEDEKIDANYLNEWEAEIKASLEDKDQKVCTEDNKAIAVQDKDAAKDTVKDDPFANVKKFRKKLEESGKPYISIWGISCKTIKEVTKK